MRIFFSEFFSLLFKGSAYDLPRHYLFAENLTNPDYYKSLFTQTVSDSVNVFGVSSAISRPPAPIFVSLLSLASTWDSLQVIIPTMLTYGIVGYPFLLPGPVGGDFQVGNVSLHALIPPGNKPPYIHRFVKQAFLFCILFRQSVDRTLGDAIAERMQATRTKL